MKAAFAPNQALQPTAGAGRLSGTSSSLGPAAAELGSFGGRRGDRVATPETLLDRVTDRDSFIAFVEALAAERADAAEIERANPQTYIVDGAHNWKHGDIDGFLYAALRYFDPGPYHQPESEPSWRVFAEMLWCGKLIE